MKRMIGNPVKNILVSALIACCLVTLGSHTAIGQQSVTKPSMGSVESLPLEYVRVQGLRRSVRFYKPEHLAERPPLVLVLHGGGGDGERFRRFTDGAFDRLADLHGFLVAYPDALGGQWNGCRSRTPYHEALAGIDEVAFLHAVVQRARDMIGRDLAGVFAVGYSNGGHLVFRLASEAPENFAALAAIGAHLPVAEEYDCRASDSPVSILLISGTNDPINPWEGGEVIAPGGGSLGHVVSAESTAAPFRKLAGIPDEPTIERHADRDTADGAWVETRRWIANGRAEIVMMVVHGGGHTLPHPTAHFPADLVGPTSRDLDGAMAIWRFFERHLPGG